MTTARLYKGAIVIAPPGVVGAWAMQLIEHAAAGCDPALPVRLLDRQDDVDLQAAPHCIFLTQYPSPSVLNIIASGDLPIVAFIDEAADSVAHMMRTTGCGFLDAMRLTTYTAAINPQLANGISVRVIRRGPEVGAARAVDGLMDHLALPMPSAALLALKQRFASAYPHPESLDASCARHVEGYGPARSPPPELSEGQIQIVETALAPLIAMSAGERHATITWPSALFLSGDRPNEAAPLVVDITGAARIIYYGPYLYLPQGEWQVEITVGFSKEAMGSYFTVEVYGSELLALARFEAKQTGLFSGTFRFSHLKPQDQIEVRFRNDQGSLEGRFGLAWVKFSASEQPPDHNVE